MEKESELIVLLEGTCLNRKVSYGELSCIERPGENTIGKITENLLQENIEITFDKKEEKEKN